MKANRSAMDPDQHMLADGTVKTTIHFALPLSDGGYRLACMEANVLLGGGRKRLVPFLRTNEIQCVTCPNCQRTKDFLDAMRALDE